MRSSRLVVLALGVSLATLIAPRGSSAARGGDAPSGYHVVNTTNFGEVVSTQKRGVKSLPVALQATLRDLTQYFGVRPTVQGAYVDVKDPSSGNARFAVTANGRNLQGFIVGRIVPAGTNVAVVFALASTPPDEWKRLTRAHSAPSSTGPSGAEKGSATPTRGAANLPLRQFNFPDGTGSIGLPEGWHTNSQSEMGGIVVQGPGDQLMLLGVPATVVTPNSQMARMQRQFRGPRAPAMLVAPFTTPLEVFENLVPQLSRASMSQGAPGFAIDNPVPLQTYKARQPGGRAAQFTVGVTERQRHYKALVQIEIDPVPPDSFTMFQTAYRAPDATFDRDVPVMVEIANSVHENGQVVWRNANQQIAARKQQNDAFQRSQREKSDAFYDQLHANQRASNERIQQTRDSERASNEGLRSADDTDEYIRGVRTVEDKQTGEQASVDLGYVDKVVDGLNEHDPDRYRQIPLRDESHPEE
jgi:hypothetical protein